MPSISTGRPIAQFQHRAGVSSIEVIIWPRSARRVLAHALGAAWAVLCIAHFAQIAPVERFAAHIALFIAIARLSG